VEVELEQKIARWMGTEAAAILSFRHLGWNVGILPGIVGPPDVILIDEYAHNSMHEGTRIARANGTRVIPFKHNNPAAAGRGPGCAVLIAVPSCHRRRVQHAGHHSGFAGAQRRGPPP